MATYAPDLAAQELRTEAIDRFRDGLSSETDLVQDFNELIKSRQWYGVSEAEADCCHKTWLLHNCPVALLQDRIGRRYLDGDWPSYAPFPTYLRRPNSN